MKKLWTNTLFWEIIGYLTLALCVFGQIAVGYIYVTAQIAYLVANALSLIRSIALHLPKANIVKDVVFTAITLSLIVIYIV